ncbi:MAG: hypothetical protein SGARI_007780 [Bacillariaceae sp.]
MGGANSRFADTAWDQVHGGLSKKEDTLDGKPPTEAHSIFTLRRPNIVNQRFFEGQVADHSLQDGEVANTEDPLYRTARIDIAWDKHAGDVKLYGKASEEGGGDERGDIVCMDGEDLEHRIVLKVEEIKSYTAQFQSYVPSANMPQPNLKDAMVHPPLCGYWVWEHSVNRHQIKMHVARGADVALQVLLAIITNQVYVETQTNQEK